MIQGQLKLYVRNDQKKINLAFQTIESDTVLGETAVMKNAPHSYSALCVKHADMYSIAKEDLMFTLELYPDVQRALEEQGLKLNISADQCKHRRQTFVPGQETSDPKLATLAPAPIAEEQEEAKAGDAEEKTKAGSMEPEPSVPAMPVFGEQPVGAEESQKA